MPLQERLAQQEAKNDRDHAGSLPPGKERDELLRQAERAESASCIAGCLTAKTPKTEK